jgi:hypothetical protein
MTWGGRRSRMQDVSEDGAVDTAREEEKEDFLESSKGTVAEGTQ